MYQEFFSLKMKPFSISPDPSFLFLSERHKEAIAHLQHGLQGYAGFALLTGEVGTGKTTICRSLVENMSDDTDIAFILNPALNETELLATICDSFNIQYQKDNLQSLFNELSSWMLDNHLKNRHAIVLIDEAQHLSFAALEQLRLLTNIETNDKKPLQVILIGQTELQEKLKQDEFRQLAQCITARYHLLSLSQQESNLYIQHRLNVSGSIHAIFDKSALQKIFKTCHGTPRLTNILCDRSLLAAYTQDSHIVTLKMVQQVIK
jgi:general secretion pathway protein A